MTISNEIINKKWVLKKRPIGMANKSDFELQEEQMDDISENEIILKNKFISRGHRSRMMLVQPSTDFITLDRMRLEFSFDCWRTPVAA